MMARGAARAPAIRSNLHLVLVYVYCIGAGEDLRKYIESRYPIDLFLIIKLWFGSCPCSMKSRGAIVIYLSIHAKPVTVRTYSTTSYPHGGTFLIIIRREGRGLQPD